jgi:hypothetical protein
MDVKIIAAVFLWIALGAFVYATRKRRLWSGLFLMVFTVLSVLLLAEFIYRKFMVEPQKISTVNEYYRQDSTIGFHFEPGVIPAVEYFEGGDTIYNTRYTIVADTNNKGIDYPMRAGYRSDTSSREVVFLGCSFTFGEGLPDSETLASQFGKLTNISTVNRACNGLGVHQVYELFLSEYGKQDNRNRVFVYSFFSEHFFRSLGMYSWNVAGPYFTLDGDSLVNHGPYYKTKPVFGHRLAQVASLRGTFSFVREYIERAALKMAKRKLTEDDLKPGFVMFRKMAEMAMKTGSRFIFLDWDDPAVHTGSSVLDSAISTGRVNEMARGTNSSVLNINSALDRSNSAYYIPKDGHPNGLANKLIATFLSKHIGN